VSAFDILALDFCPTDNATHLTGVSGIPACIEISTYCDSDEMEISGKITEM
jgi:hypothetical protein